MITAFHVKNFKALRNVSLQLTKIHALIGPNDSGKTSILNALAALSRSTDFDLAQSFGGRWQGRELVWHGDPEGVIELDAEMPGRLRYTLQCRFPNAGREVFIEEEKISALDKIERFQNKGSRATQIRDVCVSNAGGPGDVVAACQAIHTQLSGVQYYRWNPRTLALPVAPDSNRRFQLNSDGFGLALLLDDILGFDRKRFDELEKRFISLFPEIDSIKLVRQMGFRAPFDDVDQVSKLDQADGKGVVFGLSKTKQDVPASQVSDGTLLILGYLALLYSPQPPRLLLIEEPENGIHPKLLKEVLEILRRTLFSQNHTQVVLTTHSPYAVDLLDPEEVTLCTKATDGSVDVTRLAESKAVRDQLSLFTLGEIWTAEGDEHLAKNDAVSATS